MPRPEIITLDRLFERGGMYGELSYRDFTCATMELPWRQNAPWWSCIPAGAYPIKRGTFSRGDQGAGYPDFELTGVPNRSAIEMHAAERVDNLWGCIAPAYVLRLEAGEWVIRESRAALRDLLSAFRGDEGLIVINDPPGCAR